MKPPEFTKKLNDLTINDGEQLELAVKVDGDPEPQITWLKNGKVSIISMQMMQIVLLSIIFFKVKVYFSNSIL